MVNIEAYMQSLVRRLQMDFGSRLLYVGLQGSYLRGEAGEDSDIDVMVILKELTIADMDQYRDAVISAGYYDKSCGFICGLDEFRNWNRLELCHVLHTTKDYYGKLSDYVSEFTMDDVRQFTIMSINNLYHEICHRYVHRGKEGALTAMPGTYKAVFFILQNIHYLENGEFVQTKKALLQCLRGIDKEILETALAFADGEKGNAEEAYSLLFRWCQQRMKQL